MNKTTQMEKLKPQRARWINDRNLRTGVPVCKTGTARDQK